MRLRAGVRACGCARACAAAGSEGFKVYISADIEGIAGVVNEAHLGPTGFEY